MNGNGNLVAWFALFSWPVISLCFFALRQKTHSVARTAAWMITLPVMFLPPSFHYDPPLLPPVDKSRMAFLSIIVALWLFHRKYNRQRLPGDRFSLVVLLVMLAGVVGTTFTNPDTLRFGPRVLPAMSAHEGLSLAAMLWLDVYLPFAVGQRLFRTEKDLRHLLEVMSTCALIYLPFILLEVRLSPQLNLWVYGYYPSDFSQSMRQGGFRPMVFMGHGLRVAMFVFCCLCGSLALQRVHARTGLLSPKLRSINGLVLLVFCKTMAATIYAAITTLLSWFAKPRATARFALVVVLAVTVYPMTRANAVFPTKDLVGFFRDLSQERANSLEFRFDNEDVLLRRAMQRPLFGWGSHGRNRIYDQDGKDISVTDGHWIILLGDRGYIGWATYFVLLVAPLVRFSRRYRQMHPLAQQLLAPFVLMVSLLTVDLIPNSPLEFFPLIFAGALWSLCASLTQPPEPARPTATGGRA